MDRARLREIEEVFSKTMGTRTGRPETDVMLGYIGELLVELVKIKWNETLL